MTPKRFDSQTATSPSDKWVAIARVVLGMAQMLAAGVSAGLLIIEGLSRRAGAAAIAGLILTIASRLIFGRTKR